MSKNNQGNDKGEFAKRYIAAAQKKDEKSNDGRNNAIVAQAAIPEHEGGGGHLSDFQRAFNVFNAQQNVDAQQPINDGQQLEDDFLIAQLLAADREIDPSISEQQEEDLRFALDLQRRGSVAFNYNQNSQSESDHNIALAAQEEEVNRLSEQEKSLKLIEEYKRRGSVAFNFSPSAKISDPKAQKGVEVDYLKALKEYITREGVEIPLECITERSLDGVNIGGLDPKNCFAVNIASDEFNIICFKSCFGDKIIINDDNNGNYVFLKSDIMELNNKESKGR